jgi:hypothetical protein
MNYLKMKCEYGGKIPVLRKFRQRLGVDGISGEVANQAVNAP